MKGITKQEAIDQLAEVWDSGDIDFIDIEDTINSIQICDDYKCIDCKFGIGRTNHNGYIKCLKYKMKIPADHYCKWFTKAEE